MFAKQIPGQNFGLSFWNTRTKANVVCKLGFCTKYNKIKTAHIKQSQFTQIYCAIFGCESGMKHAPISIMGSINVT